jgi:large subunit ribosomal protein L9e
MKKSLIVARSHSEELLEIPEGVNVSIKTRNVVVEGECGTFRQYLDK